MSTGSLQKSHTTRSKGVSTSTTNVDVPSSGSPALPEREGPRVEGSTAKSRSKGDTPKASKRALDGADTLQSSTGPDSQKELQSFKPEKTLAKGSIASSESSPAPPERVEVENSTAGSHAEADTPNAPQRALERDSPQSSGVVDTTTISQMKKPEKIVYVSSAPNKPLHDQTRVKDSTAQSHARTDTSKGPQRALDRRDHPQSSGVVDTTTISQMKKSEKIVDVSTASSKVLLDRMGVEDSTAQSHAGTDISKGPQRTLHNADSTTTSQKELQSIESEKTLTNIGAASSESPPPPDWVDVKRPDCERLEADTSKTLRCKENPPQSSSGHNTTADSRKELQSTEPEKTHFETPDVDTPSLAKNPGSLKTQCTDGNIDVSAQGSSFDVKDGIDSGHLPSHAAHSNHNNGEVTNQNEKSGKHSQLCDGAFTLSIKEKTEVNQLLQKKELCSTEGANKQKASDLGQAEDGQATIPSTGEDVNQQMAKYEEDRILSMEIFARQQAGEHKEEIARLEGKSSSLEKIVDQQKGGYKEEIERLEGKHNKEIQRLEALVVDMGKQMSEKIERLQTKVSNMEHGTNTEHKQEIERLEEKHKKEIQRLEAIVAEMGERELKLKEIQRLQAKISSEKDAKQPEASDSTKSPDEKLAIDSSQVPQPQGAKPSSTAAKQKISGSDQEPGIKKEKNKSLPPTSASDKQTAGVAPKADSLSVTDVANLVKALNAEIGQIANLLSESLSDPKPPASDVAFDELRKYIGSWLCDKLRETSEPDPLITQLAIQTGLANACSSVVNDSPFWSDGSLLQTLYERMAEKEGQAAANGWRSRTFNYLDYLDLSQCEDASKKHLTEVLLKVVTAAVGGTLKSSEGLLSQYRQQIEDIAKLAAKLHKIINEEVRSSSLMTYTVSCDTEFDASRMEDTENDNPHGKVICTQDMGLLCRKRVELRAPWGVTMKAKVVLATTVEG